MKKTLLLAIVFASGTMMAQSNSKRVEIFKHYENGEPKEDRADAWENGEKIDDFDFENMDDFFSKDMMKDFDFSSKMTEMQTRMKDAQQKAQEKMDQVMAQMEIRMKEMQQKMDKMKMEMDKNIRDIERPNSKPETVPSSPSKPAKPDNFKPTNFT